MKGFQSGRPGFAMVPQALTKDRTLDGRITSIYSLVTGTTRSTFNQREIADAAGVASLTTARKLLNQMISAGWLYEFHQYTPKGDRTESVFVAPWDAHGGIDTELLDQLALMRISLRHPVIVDGRGDPSTFGDGPTDSVGHLPPTNGAGPTDSVGEVPQNLGNLPIEEEELKKGGAKAAPTSAPVEGVRTATPPPPRTPRTSKAPPQGGVLPLDLPRGGSMMTDAFTPSPTDLAWAGAKFPGIDLNEETERFIVHFQSTEERVKNWHARWRKWIMDEERHQRRLTAEAELRRTTGSSRDRGNVAAAVDPATITAGADAQRNAWAREQGYDSYAALQAARESAEVGAG